MNTKSQNIQLPVSKEMVHAMNNSEHPESEYMRIAQNFYEKEQKESFEAFL
jgi:hypothetical protein